MPINYSSSSLFVVVTFLEFDQNLYDFDEQVKQINKEHHGVGGHVFLAVLSSLHDHLRVIDHIQT